MTDLRVPAPGADETPVHSLRFPGEAWTVFGRVCQEQFPGWREGRARARVMFSLAMEYVRAHGTEEQVRVFERGASEMAARRSRRQDG